jgi:hypothetical protein
MIAKANPRCGTYMRRFGGHFQHITGSGLAERARLASRLLWRANGGDGSFFDVSLPRKISK